MLVKDGVLDQNPSWKVREMYSGSGEMLYLTRFNGELDRM